MNMLLQKKCFLLFLAIFSLALGVFIAVIRLYYHDRMEVSLKQDKQMALPETVEELTKIYSYLSTKKYLDNDGEQGKEHTWSISECRSVIIELKQQKLLQHTPLTSRYNIYTDKQSKSVYCALKFVVFLVKELADHCSFPEDISQSELVRLLSVWATTMPDCYFYAEDDYINVTLADLINRELARDGAKE